MNSPGPPKGGVRDLAYFGGTPVFEQDRHVGRPNIGDRDKFLERVNGALDRGWLTNDGPLVREFEARFADLSGGLNSVAVSSGTVGLEIAIRALGLSGEVIVPAFTFVATAHALEWLGIRPVFCDVRRSDYTIDTESVANAITPETSGIIGVHLWGRPCDIGGLSNLASDHQIKLIFDSAHAIGCASGGQPIGGFGSAEIFSFHSTKVVNAFEGGAIVTSDDALANRMRRMRNFGFSGFDTVSSVGTNGKMNEISAAMGLTSLESFSAFVLANLRNYRAYRAGLSGVPGIELLAFDESESPNYQYIVIDVDPSLYGFTADHLVEILHKENVLARRYFKPGVHRMEPYRSDDPPPGPFPVAEFAAARTVVLPTGIAVSPEDAAAISGLVGFIGDMAEEIGTQLDAKGT